MRALLAVCVVALIAAIPAGAWQASNYFNGAMAAGQTVTSGLDASREYNKIWRPAPANVGLSYTTSSWVFNSNANPFVDNRNAFYAQARCDNVSGSYLNPVTCQSTLP
jgi:hypothetical protein